MSVVLLMLLAVVVVLGPAFFMTAVCEVWIEGRSWSGVPRRTIELPVELFWAAFGRGAR